MFLADGNFPQVADCYKHGPAALKLLMTKLLHMCVEQHTCQRKAEVKIYVMIIPALGTGFKRLGLISSVYCMDILKGE